MYEWTVTRIVAEGSAGDQPMAGSATTRAEAWADAVEATMDRIATDEHGLFSLDVDGHPGLLNLGPAGVRQVALPETRAALERMTAAAMGVPL